MARRIYKKELYDRIEMMKKAYTKPDGSIDYDKLKARQKYMGGNSQRFANQDRKIDKDYDTIKKVRKAVKKDEFDVKDFSSSSFSSSPRVAPKIDYDKPKKDFDISESLFGKNPGQRAKNLWHSVNPFDDVTAKEAAENNRNLNKQESPFMKETNRASRRMMNKATLGTLENLEKRNNIDTDTFQTREGAGKAADLAYDLSGYLAPGTGLAKLLRGTKLGANSMKVGQLAKEGAVTGGLMGSAEVGLTEGMNPDEKNWKQNLTQVGLETAGGAILDPTLAKGLPALLGKLANLRKSNVTSSNIPENELLALPEGRLSLPQGKTRMVAREQGQPRPSTASISAKRSENPYRVKLENFFEELRGMELPPGREEEVARELWSHRAEPNDPDLDRLIELAYPSKPNVTGGSIQRARQRTVAGSDGLNRQINQPQEPNFSLLDRVPLEYTGKIQPPNRMKLGSVDEFSQTLKNVKKNRVSPNPIEQSPSVKRANKEQFLNIDAEPQLSMKRADKVQPRPEGGNADSFNAKINRNPKKEKGTTFENLRTQFVDDLAPLEGLEKTVRGKVDSAENSLYKTARLLKGSPERAHEIVRTQIGPILNKVETAGYKAEDLENYALAVHAKDVNEKGINSGFSDAEIDDVLKKLGTPEMEAARKDLMNVSDNLLKKELLDSEVISKEAYEAMREKYPNYMPLFRAFDDDKVEFGAGLGQSLNAASSPIKKLEGSNRDVVSPLESMVKNVFQATNVSDRNRVGKQLAKLSKEDTQGIINRIDPNEKTDRKNVVTVLEEGQKVKYEVPPEIYKTMKNLDRESSNTIIKLLQKPASTLRAGATLTPEFSLRNWMRDVPAAAVVSDSGFNPFVDFPVGLFQAIFKGRPVTIGGKQYKTPGDLYQKFIEDNAGYGNIVSMDRDLHRKSIQRVLKEGNTKKFVNVVNPKQWMELLRAVADVSETATKLGEYRAALRSGHSRQEAAYRARDIMDFARSGSNVREANKIIAFLNANIQGKSKLYRAFKEHPVRTGARATAMMTIPSVGFSLMQKYMGNERQQEVINDAPAWQKNTFWLVPVPGTDQVARIPKPFDLAFIANAVERSFDFAYENDKDAFDGFLGETMSAGAIPTMITGILPIIEGMANYSFFRQGPIIPMREQDEEFPSQYDVNTSETAKFLGKGINALNKGEGLTKNFGSPRVIDNTIRGLTGGLGTYATDAIDLFVEGTGIVQDVEKPDKQINQQPLAKAFLMNQATTGKSVGDVYDTLTKLKKQRNTAKKAEQEFSNEKQYKHYNDTAKSISEISSEMRKIENDPKMSGAEKRKLLDKLNEERNRIARKAVK